MGQTKSFVQKYRWFVIDDKILVSFPKRTPEQIKRSKRSLLERSFRTESYELSDGIFIRLPKLTAEQLKKKNKEVAAKNDHKYVSKLAKATPADWKEYRRKQWMHEEYRKLISETAKRTMTHEHAVKLGSHPKPLAYLSLGNRNKYEIECAKMIQQYGLKPVQFEKLDNEALEALWFDLKQW